MLRRTHPEGMIHRTCSWLCLGLIVFRFKPGLLLSLPDTAFHLKPPSIRYRLPTFLTWKTARASLSLFFDDLHCTLELQQTVPLQTNMILSSFLLSKSSNGHISFRVKPRTCLVSLVPVAPLPALLAYSSVSTVLSAVPRRSIVNHRSLHGLLFLPRAFFSELPMSLSATPSEFTSLTPSHVTHMDQST